LPFGGVACPAQRGLDGVRGSGNAMLAVGEQVDVLGGPVDEAMRDEGVAAAEGEPYRAAARRATAATSR
jgi:hypothetical protein